MSVALRCDGAWGAMGSDGDDEEELTGCEVEDVARTAKVAEDGQQQQRVGKKRRRRKRRGEAAEMEAAKREAKRTHDMVDR